MENQKIPKAQESQKPHKPKTEEPQTEEPQKREKNPIRVAAARKVLKPGGINRNKHSKHELNRS